MADIIKQLAIKNASGSGFDTRDIGTDVLNDSVGRKSDGTIVTSSSETASTTESLATTLKTHETNIGGKAPTNHASTATTYGVASSTNYGHVKTSTGITNSSGTISVSYGTTAGTACQGNDSRLSDARKNPQILTISNGAATPTTVQYDGSAAKTITYSTLGAAPTSHASSATTYGVATTANYGHVKTSTGITNSSGTISVTYGTTAGTACQGNDSRLSNSRTPTAHAYSTTAYGGGNASNFGHIKLTDTYSVTTPSASTNGAATSIAPSAYALQQAYSTLNSSLNNVYDKFLKMGDWTEIAFTKNTSACSFANLWMRRNGNIVEAKMSLTLAAQLNNHVSTTFGTISNATQKNTFLDTARASAPVLGYVYTDYNYNLGLCITWDGPNGKLNIENRAGSTNLPAGYNIYADCIWFITTTK